MFCGKGWCGKVLGGEGGRSQQTPACCSKGETHLSQPASTNSAGQTLHLHFIRQHRSTNPAEQMLPLYFTTVSAVPAARTAGAGRGFDEGTLSQLQDRAGRSGEQCVTTAATEAH